MLTGDDALLNATVYSTNLDIGSTTQHVSSFSGALKGSWHTGRATAGDIYAVQCRWYR